MNVMTAPDVWYDQGRALTVEDMEDMPDDEFRYELDDGILIVSPAPSRLHQHVVLRWPETAQLLGPPARPGHEFRKEAAGDRVGRVIHHSRFMSVGPFGTSLLDRDNRARRRTDLAQAGLSRGRMPHELLP